VTTAELVSRPDARALVRFTDAQLRYIAHRHLAHHRLRMFGRTTSAWSCNAGPSNPAPTRHDTRRRHTPDVSVHPGSSTELGGVHCLLEKRARTDGPESTGPGIVGPPLRRCDRQTDKLSMKFVRSLATRSRVGRPRRLRGDPTRTIPVTRCGLPIATCARRTHRLRNPAAPLRAGPPRP
jgi:hypothetical protein